MTVKEVRQALGNWGVALRADTPRELVQKIERNKFGHIAVVPGRINPKLYRDDLLSMARFVGVYRSIFKQSDDTVEIKGAGMSFWLGDEDDKGDVFETAVVLTAQTFADSVRALLPPGGAVVEGTLFSIPGAGTYTNRHQWESSRKALTYLTDTFSSESNIVEWRVNGNGTLDAGPISDLYNVSVPKTILVKKDTGRDMRLLGLEADMSMDYDVEDLTTRVVLLAQGEGDTITTGSADAGPLPYRDIHGNEIIQTRLVSESETTAGNADVRAALQLIRWSQPRQAIQIRTEEFDIKGDVSVGDYIYVFDPEAGFYDLENEVFWRGQPINPIALRVVEMDWGIRADWTVAFRCNDGEWLDLSEYYRPETGGSTLAVGDYRRTLAGNNYEPLGFRPNLPNPGADTTIPRAPVFTGFSVGSYQSETNSHDVKAAIRAQWAEPLNTDGSTVTDGDHYELRYRVSQVIGYQIDWDTLAGYVASIVDTFTSREVTGGWDDPETGTDWIRQSGNAINFYTDNGVGIIEIDAVNTIQMITSTTEDDSKGKYLITVPFVPSGANAHIAFVVRYVDANNYIIAGFHVEPDNDITLRLYQRAGGVATEMGGAVDSGFTHVEDSCYDDQVVVKVWPIAESDPGWQKTGTTTVLTGAGAGPYLKLDPGNDNALPQALVFDNIIVYGRDASQAYSWDDLGSWDGLVSEPVEANPQWHSVFAGWDQNVHTIMELTPGITYEIQIRAVDAASPPNRSAWSGSSFVTTTGDIFPPSTPAPPTVAASLIAIQVTHFLGKSSGGTFNLEADLDHLEVHVGGSDSFFTDNSTKVGELIATGGMAISSIPAIGTFQIPQVDEVHVKVVAVDRSGNRSPASEAATATAELIDDAHISNLSVSKLTAGTITAAILLAAQIEVGSGGNISITDGSLDVTDSNGQKQVEAGLLDDGTYGLAAVNPEGDFVKLSALAFGPRGVLVSTSGSTTNLNYVDIDGLGPSVEVEIGPTGRVIVAVGAEIISRTANGFTLNTGGGYMSFAYTGPSSGSAIDARAYSNVLRYDLVSGTSDVSYDSEVGGTRMSILDNLTPGTYTFTAKYKSAGGTAEFDERTIIVFPF